RRRRSSTRGRGVLARRVRRSVPRGLPRACRRGERMVSELVSVVMPVRNGARYIAEAIQSALDQPDAEIEVIVVDDGSTDDSARVADGFGKSVRVLRQGQLGSGPARNAGVVASSGAFLSFLDADDRFTPIKTAAQLAVFAEDSTLDAVFGHA